MLLEREFYKVYMSLSLSANRSNNADWFSLNYFTSSKRSSVERTALSTLLRLCDLLKLLNERSL